MHFEMSSAVCFNLDQSKILSSGNGLNPLLHTDCVLFIFVGSTEERNYGECGKVCFER